MYLMYFQFVKINKNQFIQNASCFINQINLTKFLINFRKNMNGEDEEEAKMQVKVKKKENQNFLFIIISF